MCTRCWLQPPAHAWSESGEAKLQHSFKEANQRLKQRPFTTGSSPMSMGKSLLYQCNIVLPKHVRFTQIPILFISNVETFKDISYF